MHIPMRFSLQELLLEIGWIVLRKSFWFFSNTNSHIDSCSCCSYLFHFYGKLLERQRRNGSRLHLQSLQWRRNILRARTVNIGRTATKKPFLCWLSRATAWNSSNMKLKKSTRRQPESMEMTYGPCGSNVVYKTWAMKKCVAFWRPTFRLTSTAGIYTKNQFGRESIDENS